MSCPSNAFGYNGSYCACEPGYWRQHNGSCALFSGGGSDWITSSGVGSSSTVFSTVLPLENIRRFTQSQAVLLEATLALLLVWLFFCFLIRFAPLRSGRNSVWFRLRWWISRFDFFFSTEHWLDDNKVVVKRKTELGGTFSVASWILFVGLFSALLYQMITKRSIEVHRLIPANLPDLQSFVNDLEFNITIFSSMSCSQLRGLDTLVIGTPGTIEYRVLSLSTYVDYQCKNTSSGPTISLKCTSCQIPRRNHYISWQFVDIPNAPAMAVGFQFNISSKDHNNEKHISFVSGILITHNHTNDKPRTFRGADLNILEVHLFPQIYKNLHDLKLIKPLVHDFVSGSSFSEVAELQASLLNPKDGLINTTLRVSYLSDYMVEIDKENVMGPVGFLANVGGIYSVSIAIFLYLLVQCEARIKKLRNEDNLLRKIKSQRRAQCNWEKLRKYVIYTWHPSILNDKNSNNNQNSLMLNSCCGVRSLHRKQLSRGGSLPIDKLFLNSNEAILP
ncbi:uncharacterized protein LOC110038105 isoform X2 [Phalaenopsis equestris]|uniref:uncharacterized protein LOC110038105 isoform X2 n=1 Tax=Phalaenopsis equestris TaxID=78828 RepID=UPI0009E501F1|nr:uncharacterized protein LOC110038105 isoform X2 [Phalaenopsis equestris]